MTCAERAASLAWLIAGAAIVSLLVGLTASGPALAAGTSGCPRPDRASNLKIMQPGTTSISFPGSRTADFCGQQPAYSKTRVWVGNDSDVGRSLEIPGVGTWQVSASGTLRFTVDPKFRKRPLSDDGPGHDAALRFSVVDRAGNVSGGVAVAYVVYPGASAFPDILATCSDGATVKPLANDVAGWRGTNAYDKSQARFIPSSLRLIGTSTGSTITTVQGKWTVVGNQVQFARSTGWSGTTPPMRYSVRDTFGNEATSTITATTCAKGRAATVGNSGSGDATSRKVANIDAKPVSTKVDPPGPAPQTWLTLGLAGLCVVIGALVLILRRRGADG